MLDSPSSFSRGQALKLTLLLLGLTFAAGLAVGTVIGLVIGFCQGAHLAVPHWANNKHPMVLIVINTTAFTLACHFGLRKFGATWPELLAIRLGRPPAFLALLVTLCGAVILISEISNLTDRILPPPGFVRTIFGPMHDLAEYPITGPLALVVMAPITEEFFFRGLLLRRLLSAGPAWPAIWTSALLFMVFHLNPWQFGAALVIGLLVGWVYARTRSLGLCLFAHAFNNGAVLLAHGLPFTVVGFNSGTGSQGLLQPRWFDALGAVLLLAGLYGLSRTTPPIAAPPTPPEPPLLVEPAVAPTTPGDGGL